MYLSSIDRPASDATPATDRSRLRGLTMVGGNVFALGTVSLLTDISAEMVTAILPVYLVFGLSMSPLAYGMIDGIYTGATALLRLVGGYVADRVRKPKAVAGIGYAMSALAKLGLLAVGRSAGAIGLVIAVDRAGKGLRTAPRDALITLSAPPQALGRAFGVHRTMDSIGAFLGPIAALAVLAATSQAIDAVLVTSFCIATLGVLIVVLFVRDRHDERLPTAVISPRQALALLRAAPVRRLLIAACLLGFAVIGDGFVYLLLQRRQEMSIGSFPLLAVGTSLAYLLLAIPIGALADRIGRAPIVLGGYTALVIVYLLLFGPLRGWPLVALVLLLYGVFYAATDGVLMALAGPVLPEHLRTTGIALVQTGQALAYLASSVLFGLAWQLWGPVTATRCAAAIAVLAVVATAFLLINRSTTPTDTEVTV
ncbi:MFS transporter [Streptomyces sp. HUAS ZL42]|uniref:MFS transporter n=1 Tax=Streptomyces sp. HUAS ZL42 TaxID=3231715 RepID=UPI00345E0C5A